MRVHHEGLSVQKIAKALTVSPSTVAKTIKCYNETGSHKDHSRKERRRVTSAAQEELIWVASLRKRTLSEPQIRAQKHDTQSSSSRHICKSTVQGKLHESGLYCQLMAAKKSLLDAIKPLLQEKQKQFVWIKKNKEWTIDQLKSVPVQIWGLWFQPCLCATYKRWTDGLYMHGLPQWSMEGEVWWCGPALLMTLFGIYSILKA